MPAVLAQEGLQEIVATQAAGRVMVFIGKDGMAVAAEGAPVEPGSRPPLIVPLSRARVAVLFGAVEWLQPGSGRPTVRFDVEAARVAAGIGAPPPPNPAQRPTFEEEATNEIETFGVRMLEKLRETAGLVHGELPLAPEDSLVEILVAGYAENYGPEVWRLRYRIAQDFLRDGYYRTRVLRPAYEQLYPPEKGRVKTMVEVRFPAASEPPELLDLVRRDDPLILRLRGASPEIARAVLQLKKDEMTRGQAADGVALLRAAVEAAGAETPRPAGSVSLILLRESRPFEWVIAPLERPERIAEETPAKPREPGAPTLRRPPK